MPESPPAVWPALLLMFAGAGFAPAGVRVANLRGEPPWPRFRRGRRNRRGRGPHRDGQPPRGYRPAAPPARPFPPRPHVPRPYAPVRRPLR